MTLTSFVNHLLAGKAPDELHPFFAGARLCALEKGNDDVRPIAAEETLRRLVSKAVCLPIKQKAGSFFGRKQYGVAAAAGAERVIHLCRRLMRNNMENDNITFCKVDLRNAFNNVSRPVFIFLTREHFPEISPWVEWCYGNHSCLTFGDDFIPSAEGVQQGDPLGPLLFSLALAEVTKEIASRSHLRTQLWYLDDGILVGEPSEVRKALDILDEIGPKWGLFLNLTKCEIITPPASAHTSVFFPDIPSEKILYDGNFDTLGSPIGSAEHCMEFLETHAIEPSRDTLEATAVLQDPQVALALIRQCAGFCQMVYALRTTPPQAVKELCQQLDSYLLNAVEHAISHLDLSARDQIQRPKRRGGFGLRSSLLHQSAAYVSSITFSANMDGWEPTEAEGFSDSVRDINDKVGADLVDTITGRIAKPNSPAEQHEGRGTRSRLAKRKYTTSLNNTLPSDSTEQETIIPRQRHLSQAISENEFQAAYMKTDARTRARWVSQSGRGAGNWAFVTPSKSRGYAFTHTEFRTLTRWWFGMNILPEDQPCPADGCTLPLLKNGEHALLCKNGHGIISRHNAVAQQFTSFCSKAFLQPQREKSLGNRGPGGALTRPADVFLPTASLAKGTVAQGMVLDFADVFLPTASLAKGTLAQGMVLDFAVTHAQQLKYLDSVRNASWVAPGSFAEHYAQTKARQRQEATEAGFLFTAMVMESFGSWSESALALLRDIGTQRANASKELMSRSQARNELLTELNVALMRSQARMMVSRICVPDPTDPMVTT